MQTSQISGENSIENLADLVKKEIEKAALPKWDIYILDEQVYGVYFSKTQYELLSEGHNLSYFIRVFQDRDPNTMGIGLAQLNTQNPSIIQDLIKKATQIAKINIHPKYDLVGPNKTYPVPKTFDKEVWDDPEVFIQRKGEELRQHLHEMGNVQNTFGKFRTYKIQKMLVNSAEFRKLKRSTYHCYEFAFKAEESGKTAEYWPRGYFKTVDQLKFDEYMREWVALTRDGLKATPPMSFQEIDVIFPAPVVRTALLSTVGYTITGQALFERTSKFTKDETVAADSLTLSDDGLIEGGLNTSAWDSEGNPKQKTPVIEKGVMKNFLFDQKIATLLKTESTGNAQRKASAGGVMQIEINNLVIQPGSRPLRDIVADTKFALIINDLSWLNPNPISGEFGAEIRNAYLIENGALTRPIKGGNLSGNVYTMIKNILDISRETRVVMNAQVPYIKFQGLRLTAK